MTSPRIIVIGASSGGLDVLRGLVGRLPADFPAPICVVLHVSPQSPGILYHILRGAGQLEAVMAQTGMKLRPGTIYVAPPDHHLLVEPGVVRLSRGPKENRFRPAIDPLFRSAAQAYGPAAIGVILTGNLDDGTAGLLTIKRLGGVAVVQDPAEAMYPSMPRSALAHVAVDASVPSHRLADVLLQIVTTPVSDRPFEVPDSVRVEVAIAGEERAMEDDLNELGHPSIFACPECHGVLLQMKDRHPLRFRCHTGHAYSAESLLADVNDAIEDSLYNALRALEEGRMLLHHIVEHQPESQAGLTREHEARLQHDIATLRRLVTERSRLASVSE
jgi:two-component system, chemotaxis family, protein-glutamate methylesterase/glutaminase